MSDSQEGGKGKRPEHLLDHRSFSRHQTPQSVFRLQLRFPDSRGGNGLTAFSHSTTPGLKVRPHICPHQSTSQQRTKLQPGKSPQCFLCKTSVGTRTAGKIAATDEKKRYMQPFALNTETVIHFHFPASSGFDYRRKNRLRLLPILHNYANIGRYYRTSVVLCIRHDVLWLRCRLP